MGAGVDNEPYGDVQPHLHALATSAGQGSWLWIDGAIMDIPGRAVGHGAGGERG